MLVLRGPWWTSVDFGPGALDDDHNGNFTVKKLWQLLPQIFLLFWILTVSCQIPPFEGFIQKAVLLPCIYNASKIQHMNVFWRDSNGSNVLDIKGGKENLSNQNVKYKRRVTSFTDEYSQGNFSITLNNLQLQDSGVYNCFILSADVKKFVNLTVSAEPTRGLERENPFGAGTKICLHLPLLAAPFLSTFL